MLPDIGTVMVLVAGSTDCPEVSVYGPAATTADTNMTEAITVFEIVMVLASKVTAPIRVSALPSSVAPVASEIDWSARMVP